MSNHIQFTIGSSFSGEGFSKLQSAVKESNRHVQKGITAASQLSQSLASVDASAARAGTACTQLLQAFAQGGISGAAFAGVVMLINYKLNEMKEEIARINKEAAELEGKINKSFSENLSKRIGDTVAYTKLLSTEFERLAKHATQVEAAITGLQAAKADGGIIALQTEKLNATMGEMEESLRQSIAASYDVRIAEAKLAKAKQDAVMAEEAATLERNNNRRRITSINEQIATLDEEILTQKKTASNITQADADKAHEIMSKIATLETARAELIAKRKEAADQASVLEVKLNTVKQQNENKLAEQAIAVKEATEAERALNEKIRENVEAEETAALEKEQERLVRKDYQEALSHRTESERAADEAAKNLVEAQKALQTAIENYEKNIVQNLTTAAINGTDRSGVTNPRSGLMSNWKNIQDEAARVATSEGLKDGSIKTVRAYEEAEKAAARSAREYMSSEETNRQVTEAARADRISKMSAKARSKSDQEFLDKYNKVRDAQNADQEAIDQARMNEQAARENYDRAMAALPEACQNIQTIKEKMEALGLQ